MTSADPRTLLDRHAARILARWREQLRALPPSSALAAPELLTPLMAPALARLRHEAAASAQPALPAPGASPECRCGLNPLLAFYLTGEFAVFEVLWSQPDALAPLAPDAREELCARLRAAWRRIAREGVETFCSLCQNGRDTDAPTAAERRAMHAHTKEYARRATEAADAPVAAISASARGASGAARGRSSATARRSVGIPG